MRRKGTEVRGVLGRSVQKPPPKMRFFGWTPPTDWWSGGIIAWQDLAVTATGGTRDVTCIPADRKLVAGDVEGGPVTLKLVVPTLNDLQGSTAVASVRVRRRDRGGLQWREVWEVGETLQRGGRNLLVDNADFGPPSYRVDAPAGGVFTEAGDAVKVTVTALRDDYYKAFTKSGTVKVVADMEGLAGATAQDDMEQGKTWNGPSDEAGQKLLEDYNNDEGGIKTQAKKIMSAINGMTKEELTRYMNRLGVDSTRTGHPPNIIWDVMPGLQVRYKPWGDDRRGPCFCIEGKTSDGFSFNQDTCAFKLMPDGEAGPKGVNDTLLPQWVLDAPKKVFDAYMDAACDMTHISCRK